MQTLPEKIAMKTLLKTSMQTLPENAAENVIVLILVLKDDFLNDFLSWRSSDDIARKICIFDAIRSGKAFSQTEVVVVVTCG